MPIETDILVTGGGLAGLFAAYGLARSGRSVTVLAPSRSPDGRTTALLGASIQALRDADIWAAIEPRSHPLRSIRIVDGSKRLFRGPEVRFDASEVGLPALGYNIPNEPLLTTLEQSGQAAGVRFVNGKAVGVQPLGDAILVSTDDGLDVSARLIVAADGRGSFCRQSAGIGLELTRTGQVAVVCNLSHSKPHNDVSTEFHTETGPFTLVPLAEGRSALVWVLPPDEASRVVAMDLESLARAIETRSQSLLGDVRVDSQAQSFPLASGVADRLAGERIVLIGEAAHVLPPIGAQGFNLTVRDVATLIELIGASGPDCGSKTTTDGYDRARRHDIRTRSQAVSMLNRSLLTEFLPVHFARSLGLLALSKLTPLRQFAMREGLGA